MAIVNSAPAYHVTGAVHHYITVPGTASSTYYLGTCEVQPDIRIWKLSAEAKNDIAGRILPGQKTHQGEKADIGLQLSRYSEAAYEQILLAWGNNTDGSNGLQVRAGHEGRFSRGNLVFGVRTFQMWQVFERSVDSSFRGAQPYGYWWPQVELIQHAPVELGNKEKQLLLVLEAQPYFVPQTSHTVIGTYGRTWKLYSQADADFPAEVLIPQ
jgi:hypothetical protein